MFCKYCGKEHLDEAVVCPHCGMMVKQIATPAAAPAKPLASVAKAYEAPVDGVAKGTKMAKLFGMFAAIAIAVTFLFVFITIANLGLYSTSRYSIWDEDLIIAAWLFGWTALGMGITSFIMSVKQKDMGVKYVSLVVFIMSILAYLVPVMFLSF